MAGRPGLDPIEEGKSFSALFVLMIAVLLVSAIWAIWDDNISRRPWKEYQVEFDRLAYNKYMKDVADEQKKLNDNPDYVKDEKDLKEARAQARTRAKPSASSMISSRRKSTSRTSPTTRTRRSASPNRSSPSACMTTTMRSR